MTPLRPEREGRPYEPYESGQPYASERPHAPQEPYNPPDPYGDPDAFEEAVGRLDDPLNDPLPGLSPQRAQTPAPSPFDQPSRRGRHAASEGAGPAPSESSPWFRPHSSTEPRAPQAQSPARHSDHGYVPSYATYAAAESIAKTIAGSQRDDETMALRQAKEADADRDDGDVSRETVDRADVSRETSADDTVSRETSAAPIPGGRAARRKAAQEAAKRGGRRGRHGTGASAAKAATPAKAAAEPPPAPTSRLEARRAARAAKESLSLIVSRAVGEVFITLGVLMLLFVTYQLWWTNVMAGEEAGGAATTLQHEWDKGGGEKKNLAVGERFGIIYIPKLDVKAPIAEGVDKHNVLDHGMVGHYDKSSGIKTAMPWDKKGNFALAAHRNTHGEPFRYINRLTKGDKIVVETQSAYYTYEMESVLPQTSPSNTSVIGPVPPGSGFTGPGRYITLTTCTPEFTSTFRMIVWGKMVDERPRSKGQPPALTG
ncbi:class E sortase [Streptomyces natalensis]|uniref:Peptidase C60 family protein n=1 Tax=Streptomyces natalensis ATCC 27448 TaxID=1240678 RepID=A0A0D7CVK7_9ACTN|nr:class E sortase [Streptomyces natalensis]KIZ19417.1 hypothetical protein SNA_02520 [Streptomyces natalensis ATCC 27448]